MRFVRLLVPLTVVLVLPLCGWAQGGAYRMKLLDTPSGAPQANALITVCAGTDSLAILPCRNKTTVYSDVGLTMPLSNPFRADQYGNVLFYDTPGTVHVVSVTGVISPGYSFVMQTPSSVDTSGFLGANNPWTGNETHAGIEHFAGGGSTDALTAGGGILGAQNSFVAAQNVTLTGVEPIGLRVPVYAQGYNDALFLVHRNSTTSNTPQNSVRASAVIEEALAASGNDCGGGDANTYNYSNTLLVSTVMCDNANTSGMNTIAAIGTVQGGGLRGSFFPLEVNMNNKSGADAIAWDTSDFMGDIFNANILSTSVGTNKGGAGLLVKSNNAGAGNFKRGIVVQDWDSAGLSINNNYASSLGYGITLEQPGTTQANSIVWTVNGGANVGANLRWIMGYNTGAGWSLFDSVNSVNRLNMTGLATNINSFGTNPVQLAFDSGTGGVIFGNGAGASSGTTVFNTGKLTVATGVQNSGTGIKHMRFASCSTTSSQFNECTTSAQNWPGTAFADTNYTVTCSIEGSAGAPTIAYINKSASQITGVTIMATTAAIASGTIDCIAMHD